MTTLIALLRGINVGGHNMVAMSDLRDLCAKLKLPNAKTLLQSGNLVFQTDRMSDASLERLLEAETLRRFGVPADYVIRSADEFNAIIAGNPFGREAKRDPSHLLVMFLKSAPQGDAVKSLRAGIKGPEIIHSDGKQLYLVYPAGIGRSKLTGTLVEKVLGVRGTARNWNTIMKLARLANVGAA